MDRCAATQQMIWGLCSIHVGWYGGSVPIRARGSDGGSCPLPVTLTVAEDGTCTIGLSAGIEEVWKNTRAVRTCPCAARLAVRLWTCRSPQMIRRSGGFRTRQARRFRDESRRRCNGGSRAGSAPRIGVGSHIRIRRDRRFGGLSARVSEMMWPAGRVECAGHLWRGRVSVATIESERSGGFRTRQARSSANEFVASLERGLPCKARLHGIGQRHACRHRETHVAWRAAKYQHADVRGPLQPHLHVSDDGVRRHAAAISFAPAVRIRREIVNPS